MPILVEPSLGVNNNALAIKRLSWVDPMYPIVSKKGSRAWLRAGRRVGMFEDGRRPNPGTPTDLPTWVFKDLRQRRRQSVVPAGYVSLGTGSLRRESGSGDGEGGPHESDRGPLNEGPKCGNPHSRNCARSCPEKAEWVPVPGGP